MNGEQELLWHESKSPPFYQLRRFATADSMQQALDSARPLLHNVYYLSLHRVLNSKGFHLAILGGQPSDILEGKLNEALSSGEVVRFHTATLRRLSRKYNFPHRF